MDIGRLGVVAESRSRGELEVPFLDLRSSYLEHRSELDGAIASAIRETDFVAGARTERFETEFSDYCGVKHGIGCANGTDALELVFEAAGIRPGDEIITVSHTFSASVSAILRVGAIPVLVDVEPATLLMDTSALASAVSERTVAILVVHLYGSVVPMESVLRFAQEKKLLVLEDAAQAHGARWQGQRAGSFGTLSTFSFYPGKNLGAFGDGGAILTNDDELADRCRILRDHGKTSKFVHAVVGRNSRLDGLQAAVLSVKLRYLDEENEARRRAYTRYREMARQLAPGVEVAGIPDEVDPVHHLAVVKVPMRDETKTRLEREGVGVGIHYPIPIHRQPAFADRVRVIGDLKVTESACEQILSLPIFPTITEDQQKRVVDVLAKALS